MRLGELPELGPPDELDGFLLGAGKERDHAAEVAHLALRDLVPRMRLEPRVEHALDRVVLLEERDDGARVFAVLTHPHRERLHAAQHEPAVERPGNRAERFLQEVQPFRDRRVVRRDEAADDEVPRRAF